MSALDSNPLNLNFLSPLGFKLLVKRLPNVAFFVQSVKIPGLSVTPVVTGTPFSAIPYSGDRAQFEPLEVEFAVDEDMRSWLEIRDWLVGLTFPERFSQYADLKAGDSIQGLGVKSDLTLMVLTSSKNANLEIIFRDAFPTSLGSFQVSSTAEDVSYVTSKVSFSFTWFEVNQV